MKIGIDISQIAYEGTGVARLLSSLVEAMIETDKKNEYILFFSSFRRNINNAAINNLTSSRVKIKKFPLPQSLLDIMWNKLHIVPIEWFIGEVDIFITSDWTEPPVTHAWKGTILYDLIVYKFPQETAERIIETQKKKLKWVKKESQAIFCISEATKQDAEEILGIDKKKLFVIHPGV